MTARTEIDVLANYIMAEVPGEPSQSEGAGTTAIRIIKELRQAMRAAMNELGVPHDDYPAPIANAYEILADARGEGENAPQ